jgi:hypothetical protein
MFLPSQGIFNFIIFIRPRYSSLRRNFPRNSALWALFHSVWSPASSPSVRQESAKKASALCRMRSVDPNDNGRAQQSEPLDSFKSVDLPQSEDEVNFVPAKRQVFSDDVCSDPMELGCPSSRREDSAKAMDDPSTVTRVNPDSEVSGVPEGLDILVNPKNPTEM